MSNDFLKPTGKKVTATVVTLVGIYLASLISQGILSLMLSKEITALKSNTAVLSMTTELLKDMPYLFTVGIYAIIVKLIVTVVIVYICICFAFWLIAKSGPNNKNNGSSNEAQKKTTVNKPVQTKTLPLGIIRKQALGVGKKK